MPESNLLPLMPGNSGKIIMSEKASEAAVYGYRMSNTKISPKGIKCYTIEGKELKLHEGTLIGVVSDVLVDFKGSLLETIVFNTKGVSNLLMHPSHLNRIEGLSPINSNPPVEI